MASHGGADAGAPSARFAVPGPFRVRSADGAAVPAGPPLHRQVLATLILSAGVPRTSAWLAQAIWGQRLPGDPGSSLRTAVYGLRRRLGLPC